MAYVNVIPQFEQALDWNVVREVERFFIKVNERLLNKLGVLPSYDDGGDAALGEDVEYFHFNITGDDRMRYLGQYVVLEPHLSPQERFCNAVITHLYGGRRINSLLTGESDPRQAHLDFKRLHSDPSYVQSVYDHADYAAAHGFRFFGTTELHTSLQTAARNYCRQKYSDPTRRARNTDIAEWVASWLADGTVDSILSAPTLAEAFNRLTHLPGVGAYYGYHLAVDSSLIPGTVFHHDEPFCVPGPGAQRTMDLLFPTLKDKLRTVPYGDLIVWIEQNQQRLYPQLTFHPALYNITHANGTKLFEFDQDKLMVYGCEVGHCQFGVYKRLQGNAAAILKRRCATDPDLSPLRSRRSAVLQF